MRKWTSRFLAATVVLAASLGWAGAASADEGPDTVTISGNAWAFVLTGTTNGLEGAVIRVAEYPELQTVSGEKGAWSLEVPNNASITPYATAPGRYTVHDQTFFTRGQDLNQINFQMPPQAIAEGFALLVGAGMSGEEGSKVLDECAIVSTVYMKEGRSFFDFDDFLAFAPHGIENATAEAFDVNGQSIGGPVYFGSNVIPNPALTGASNDGGLVWDSLPAGTYTVKGSHETARFSQFQATCAPGRLINASPPWGLYELHRNEEPNPAVLPAPVDSVLEASVISAKVLKQGPRKRVLKVQVKANEDAKVTVTGRQGKRRLKGTRDLKAGTSTVSLPVGSAFRSGSLSLTVKLVDDAGNSSSSSSQLFVPAVKSGKRK